MIWRSSIISCPLTQTFSIPKEGLRELPSDELCIYIRPFSQLFNGYGNSTANDDQDGFEFSKFRCAVIRDRERCSASRLYYYPVIGKESQACEYSSTIRDHDAVKKILL